MLKTNSLQGNYKIPVIKISNKLKIKNIKF